MKIKQNVISVLSLMCAAAITAAVFLFGAGSLPVLAAGSLGEIRLGGPDRIVTSAAVSDEGWAESGAPTVVIANGYSYPDAMAGVPLAACLDAPILLTKGGLPEQTILDQLSRLNTDKVIILGGESSVSSSFVLQLITAGCSVERISGSDRYSTCAAVAERISQLNGAPEEVFIASGTNFPDALSISAAAGVTRRPILYTDPQGGLSADTLDFIRRHRITRAVVLGGETAVPPAVCTALGSAGVVSIERISGSDRYQTSLAINRRYSEILESPDIMLSSGADFPDALSGGALAARYGMPVMLVSSTASVPGAYEFLTGRSPRTTYILGLEGALSSYVVRTFLSGGTITTTTTTTTTTTAATTAVPANAKKAYLTFDDGPSANTAKILDILDRFNAKATFFVVYRKGFDDTCRDIVRRGHTLALHSYSHRYSDIYKSTGAYFNDLEKLSDHLHRLTGLRPTIMRFPGGSSNTVSRSYCRGIMTTLTAEVQKRGYRYYDWNVDSGDADAERVSASTLVSNIKDRCGSQKEAVILMHDSPSKSTTVDALPEIIRYLQSKGYVLLPITGQTPPVHHNVNN